MTRNSDMWLSERCITMTGWRSPPSPWSASQHFASSGRTTAGSSKAIPNQVIGTYIERDDELRVPLHAIHRDLALHMENSYSSNERRRLRPLRWGFRVAVIALVAEVSIWLVELATAG